MPFVIPSYREFWKDLVKRYSTEVLGFLSSQMYLLIELIKMFYGKWRSSGSISWFRNTSTRYTAQNITLQERNYVSLLIYWVTSTLGEDHDTFLSIS